MKQKMGTQSAVMVFFVMVSLCGAIVTVGAATVQEQCTKDFDKVTQCLNYVTGKAATPTKDCCSAVKDIRDSDPVCLCYFIQQTHNGSQQIKSLGIQEAKLLQLPSACSLVNASVSDCPKLLNIPAGSPEAAIFTNLSSSSNASTTPVISTPTTADDSSNGFKHEPYLAGPVATIAVAILFYAFPAWSISAFYT
ncbi:hypothetical protein L1049_005731 [Liquidambar formosana]|uniref:Bifunctional inhibitor/plant lipid transfer protein/seed storage helical domain-containing protein n=1 Tax=Liquidambar formosana TaxID=63359 RepID=A0AAP0RFV6_LIQFO